MRGCFVTATDTGVGKTVLAAALAAALTNAGMRVAAYKPAVTGIDEPEPGVPPDDELLAAITGQRPETVAPRRFGPPVSPHLAAQLADEQLDPCELVAGAERAARGAEALIVEGVGGLMVPLAEDFLVCDLARALGLPLVIAARPGLGTINHTLLSVSAARAEQLDVCAVVLTPWPDRPDVVQCSNRDTIARLAEVEVATLPRLASYPRPAFAELARAGGDLGPQRWIKERASDGAAVEVGSRTH